MKYVCLIYQGSTPTPDDPEAWGALSPEEQQGIYRDYQTLNQVPGFEPGWSMAGPDQATTVRVDGDRTLTTDGPFAEVKDAIGGFFSIEAESLDEAIEVAAKLPPARLG